MVAALTQRSRRFDSERERLRRRNNRHARLAADRAVAEVALGLRVRDQLDRGRAREDSSLGRSRRR
jgi:hypothetical protein